MATYDNLRTGVVHWTVNRTEPCLGLAFLRFIATACGHMREFTPLWSRNNYSPLGTPADVTCCHCRETASFLDAAHKAFDEEDSTR